MFYFLRLFACGDYFNCASKSVWKVEYGTTPLMSWVPVMNDGVPSTPYCWASSRSAAMAWVYASLLVATSAVTLLASMPSIVAVSFSTLALSPKPVFSQSWALNMAVRHAKNSVG